MLSINYWKEVYSHSPQKAIEGCWFYDRENKKRMHMEKGSFVFNFFLFTVV